MPTKRVPPLAYLTPQSLEDPYACEPSTREDDDDKENARPRTSDMASTRRAVADVDSWVHKLPQGLALFTAELVCFLWFSPSLGVSTHILHSNPTSPLLHIPSRIVHPLSPSSTSSYGFPPSHHPLLPKPAPALHLWPSQEFHSSVDMILRTTQVSHQVVLLAMLYIDRFKKSSPTAGERGTELRLLVVALLLANKTLDDSAYTNKTWSEVSRLSLADLNRGERQFLGGIAFDLWTSSEEFQAWLQRADDLQRSRQSAISTTRSQPVASRVSNQPYASPFTSHLSAIPNLSTSQRPSSSGSASFYPSLDPLALPPLPLAHPASVAQRQGPPLQPPRVPQMSMAQFQVGSSQAYPSSSDAASHPHPHLLHPPPSLHQQPPNQAWLPFTMPLAASSGVQQQQVVPPYATQPVYPQQNLVPARSTTSGHRQHLSASSSSSLHLPRPQSSSHSVDTPRRSKRPAGEAFSSPPLPTSYEMGPASKRQQRGSFDSSAVSTPLGTRGYPPPPLHQQQVPALSREMMGALGMGAGGSAAGSSAGGHLEMGLGAGFGTMGGAAGVPIGRRGPVQWPSMQEWSGGSDALYAPVVYQEMDSNGDVQLYVQTLRASPLADSPSYRTYRKAVLQTQAAPPYAQPRNPSNLGQASTSYTFPDSQSYPQPTYSHQVASQAPAQQQSAHLAAFASRDPVPQAYRPSSSSAARPTSQGLVEGQTSPPEVDWRTGRLEMWRRGVVSTPVSEEEQ